MRIYWTANKVYFIQSGKYEGRPTLERQIDYDVSDELPLIAAIIKQVKC